MRATAVASRASLPVSPVEQLRIVVAAVGEREARRFARVRRQVVQGAVQIRDGRFADVDLSQQGEQPIRRPGPPCHALK